MQRLTRLIPLLALLALLPAPLAALRPAAAQQDRTVTASAQCIEASANGQSGAQVAATVTNRTGAPITVVYVHGFTTGQAFSVRMRIVQPEQQPVVTIPDGGSQTIRAGWDDLRPQAGNLGAALIVTSAGALTPACGDQPQDAQTIRLGPAPASPAAAKEEAARTDAHTIGQLEAWRAYPALYALLHPDSRAQVPFAAVACWYYSRYSAPGQSDARVVLNTNVTGVQFGSWTWQVNGTTYPDAATITQQQQIGSVAHAQTVASTEHLVEADGFWRWLFGSSRTDLAAQGTDCGLGPETAAGGAAAAAGNGASAGTGSIEVAFYDCKPGMTVATFSPQNCKPAPSGFDVFTLTPGPGVDASKVPGGPIIKVTGGKAVGGGRFLIAGLPFGTYQIGPGNNYSGPLFYAPNHGSPVGSSGPGASTYKVTISSSTPNVSILFFRLN